MMDLTTLEGKDTEGKVRALCAKGIRPDPSDPSIPSVAAICIYPAWIPVAREALAGTGVHVASVATGFPSGQTFTDIKLTETRLAVEAGADEIDMVIDRGAFLAGDYATVFDEIVAVKAACGDGAPQGHPRDRRARDVRQRAAREHPRHGRRRRLHQDLDGKVTPAATLPVTLVMLEAIRDFHRRTGRIVGHEAGRRHPDRQGGDRLPRGAVRDARPALDDAGPVPLRRQQPAQRLPHAAAQGAHRAATRAPTTSRSTDRCARASPSWPGRSRGWG